MADKDFIDGLRNIEFLEDIEDEYVELLATVSERVSFDEAAVIFREGDPAESVFLISSGSVSLEVCAPALGCRRILTIEAGNLLGWSPVLGQSRFTSTARTLSATEAYKISASQILMLCEHDPRFGFAFMRRAALGLAKRLRAARLQVLDVFGGETSIGAQATNESTQ